MTDATKAAVIGLGSMGYGVATSLLRAGIDTMGADVSPEPCARFREAGGGVIEGPDDYAGRDVVVVVVVNAAQTEAVLFGEAGIAAHLDPGTVIVSCATVAPDFARRMEARCTEAGLLYLDAPISGGQVRAADGSLAVMAAGAPAAFAKARPVLDAMAATVFALGDAAGPGSAMKAVNQLLVGVQLAAMGEALTFGMTQGVSPEQFLEVIPKCAGTSWVLENRAPHVVAGDYTPLSAVDIWLKDLGIVSDIARASKFSAPLVAAALQQFVAASGTGLGQQDDAAVTKIYARNAGLTLPGEG
ncbi:putative dehydrogenase [Rhodovulum iodosum]|uniref:L-threonate dehydrogenase n=1 Tax=Rhodovulum iodosum TaxID=68291 RepID=A0ABV3XW28_9RHOB|nr:L-threonate dehydrogenase [Rhodovulum robiginosum]RSK36478.1 NAD(P)-dependent oxidoreductase [Rhodovulum robiginosum]